MSDSEPSGLDVTPQQLTVVRLADAGFSVLDVGALMVHPDGTIMIIRSDGTSQRWDHLADARRSNGRGHLSPVEFDPAGKPLV